MEFYKKYAIILLASLSLIYCICIFFDVIKFDSFITTICFAAFSGWILQEELRKYKSSNKQ
ncbi:MAG: hypothetical protein ACOVO1_09510 [Chitinophagaceae bacterium]